MLTETLEMKLRSQIDPHRKDMPGTYSYEIHTLLGEINRLRHDLIMKENMLAQLKRYLVRSMACFDTLADEIKSKQP